MLEKEELEKRFIEFIKKYEDNYDQLSGEYEFLEMSIPSYLLLNYKDAYYNPRGNDTILYQIFSAIGALPKEVDPYYQIMKNIEQEYGLERDIIEVGCGMFPALCLKIAERQKEIGKGTITGYDPELVTTSLDGVVLKKEKFTLATPLPKNALIIGQKPCEATETIIRKSSIKNLEFYIQLCECKHNVPTEYKLSHLGNKNLWDSYINEITENTLPEGFIIEKRKQVNPIKNISQSKRYYKAPIEDQIIMTKKKR